MFEIKISRRKKSLCSLEDCVHLLMVKIYSHNNCFEMPWCHRVHYDIVDTYCDYFVNDSSYVLIITKTKPYKNRADTPKGFVPLSEPFKRFVSEKSYFPPS